MKKWFTILFIITFLFSVQAAHVWATPVLAAPVEAAGISDIHAAIDSNKLVTVSGTLSTGAGQVVSVRILDPKGHTEYAGSTVTGSWGNFLFAFTMRNTAAGNYRVDLNALGLASPVTTGFQYGVNNDLKDLVISSGGFDKAFSPAITEYTVSVDRWVSSITVTPMLSDNTAQVTVNNNPISSGSPSGPIMLNEGTNTINVVVTALNGNTKSYTLTVTRQKATSSNLTANASIDANRQVTVSGTVSSGAGQIVTLLIMDPGKNVEYAGVTFSTSGGSYKFSYTLSNTAKGRYTVAVRALGVAQPVTTYFDYGTDVAENVPVPAIVSVQAQINSGKQVTVSGIISSPGQQVSVMITDPNGKLEYLNATTSGTAGVFKFSYTMLNNTKGRYDVAVGVPGLASPVSTYFIYNTGNAGLKDLAISSGSLYPQFAPDNLQYTASVGYSTSSITITPTAMDSTAAVKVNNMAVTSGNASGSISLTVGVNKITIVVTSQDKTQSKTYTLTVTRKRKSSSLSRNAYLSGLTVSSGTLTPAFASGTTSYTVSVANNVYSITLTPIAAESHAAVKVNGTAVESGTASGPISLDAGDNTVSVVVTAQAGTTKTYTITVTREETISGDASLSSLVITGECDGIPADIIWNWEFAPDQFEYSVTSSMVLTSVTLTPTVNESHATAAITITVNETTVELDDPYTINIDYQQDTLIDVTVTAQDGTTTQRYIIFIPVAE